MNLPDVLQHNDILGPWKDYPEGSVERAKSLGGYLYVTFKNVHSFIEDWDEAKELCERDRPWEALRFDSFDSLLLEMTGHTIAEGDRLKFVSAHHHH